MNLLRFVSAGDANVYATFIQAVGLWMFALLLVILARAVRRDWFDDFAKGFVFLAAAVSALRAGFALGADHGRAFFIVYFLGEYLFLYFTARGTKGLAGQPSALPPMLLLAVGVFLAVEFSLFSDFSFAFVFQAAIMATGFFVAFVFALRKPVREFPGFGLHLLRFSLFVLGVGFAQYVPVIGIVVMEGRLLPETYTTFMPVFDLLFEALLASAMIVTGMESIQLQLRESNASLEEARERVDLLARTDPLTELLNRHAFAAVVDAPSPRAVSGAVAVVDLDGLKAINDSYGHSAGDQAIRGFAAALRARLRSDDLVFRWGGDEFLVVMFGLSPDELGARLGTLGAVDISIDGDGPALRVGGSFGVAPFASLADLRAATAVADSKMYTSKRSRAGARAAAADASLQST